MATPNSETSPILVVAALGRELASLNREAVDGVALLETGEGTDNARRSLDDWLEQNLARAIVSIGFAGALSNALQAGDLVIASKVRDGVAQPDKALLSAAQDVPLAEAPVNLGIAITTNEIIWQARSKRALAATLEPNEIGIVDMESTAIASICARHGLPFLIVRSITDLLDEDLPLNFNLYRGEDGRVDSARIVKAALIRPRALSGLMELRRRSELCATRMADFVRVLVPLISQSPRE
jgi:adenosylhomocysteine nucleosidase